MGVERNSKKFVMHEISGYPMSVITYVSKNDFNILNIKETQFVNDLIKDDVVFFIDFNEKQGYESIKYRKNVSSTLANRSYIELLSYVVDLFIRSPYLTITQTINQTCSLYAYRYKKEHDINKFYAYIYYFLQNIEIPIILLLIISTIFIKNNDYKNSSNFILALPIIIYSFLICFIITSPWILRYYMQMQMVAPVIIINNLIN